MLIYAVIAIAIILGADYLFWYLILPRILGNPVLFLYTMGRADGPTDSASTQFICKA